MLTAEEKEEILEEAKIYPRLQSACIDALRIVQKHRRWISDESVKDIAEFARSSRYRCGMRASV